MKKESKYKWENGEVIDQKTGEIYVHEQHAYWNYRHKIKENKELIIISGFMGFAIGVLCMMFINVDKESRLKEQMKEQKTELELQIEQQDNILCLYYEECEECLLYTPCYECCENCDEID